MEAVYIEELRQLDLVVKDEGERRLRVQIHLLEDENGDLHEQLAMDDERIDQVERDRDETQAQIVQMEEHNRRLESELRASTRELNNLRVGIRNSLLFTVADITIG
jgi:uncharacterized coiled-coil DUF342 family protein